MKFVKSTMSVKDKLTLENLYADNQKLKEENEKNKASIDYISMMTGVDIDMEDDSNEQELQQS
jgi:hypothetical protein